jgi:hypothetical protein
VKRFLLRSLALLAILGLLTPFASPQRAYACTCAGLTPAGYLERTELVVLGIVQEVRFLGPVDEVANRNAPNVVVNQSEVTGRVTIQVEAFLKGRASDVVTEQDQVAVWRDSSGQIKTEFNAAGNCRYFSGVPVGERHLLFLSGSESGLFGTGACSASRRLHPTSDPEPYTRYNEFYTQYLSDFDAAFGFPPGTLSAAANSSGPVSLPGGGGPPASDTFPAIPAATLAILTPLAFLAGAAFLWRPSRASG